MEREAASKLIRGLLIEQSHEDQDNEDPEEELGPVHLIVSSNFFASLKGIKDP